MKINYHPTKFGGQRQCGSKRYSSFSLSWDLSRLRDQRVMYVTLWAEAN